MGTKNSQKINVLDKLLSFWEDQCFLTSIAVKFAIRNRKQPLCPLSGPLIHFSEFRKGLLKEGAKFNFMKFMGNLGYPKVAGTNIYIPMTIFKWSHFSRRIFKLNTEMQTLLDATSLGGMKWGDIKFPFESFLLSLEDPLIDDEGIEYDHIFVSRIDDLHPNNRGQVLIDLRLLPKNLVNYQGIGKRKGQKVELSLENGDLMGVFNFTSWAGSMMSKFKIPTIHFTPEDLKDEVIAKSLPKLGELTNQPDMSKDSAMDSALHILLNFCLYLQNFPNSTSRVNGVKSKKKKNKKTFFNPVAITDISEIFNVFCEFNIKKDELQKIVRILKETKPGRGKRPHWRTAHWRRKPYFGNIPMAIAPKDWIPQKFINANKLPKNSLPIGSEASLT